MDKKDDKTIVLIQIASYFLQKHLIIGRINEYISCEQRSYAEKWNTLSIIAEIAQNMRFYTSRKFEDSFTLYQSYYLLRYIVHVDREFLHSLVRLCKNIMLWHRKKFPFQTKMVENMRLLSSCFFVFLIHIATRQVNYFHHCCTLSEATT